MSNYMKLLHCSFCDKIVCGYQELLNHVQSHQIHQSKEMYVVEGSNIPSVELTKPSSVKHVRTKRSKRVDLQSTPSPLLVHPSFVRGNDSDKDLHVNQQLPLSLPPPPSSLDR